MTIIDFPKGAERYFVVHDRQESIKVMKALYEKGYRWVVRNLEMDELSLFSCKPKKYLKLESWGYTDSDLRTDKSMMSESIKNTDITEIRWQNRQPTELEQFIKDNEVAE